ncbi:MAG: glycosyltransferase family 1 protein [Saprospiraceae bacterium]|nr:glycosyltransferase family 1 protein [Saprospiraceae bacterium]
MKIAVNARELLKGRMEGIGRYIFETTRRMVLDHPEDEFYFFFDRAYDSSFIFADNVFPVVVHPQARHPILWYLWFEWVVPYYLKKYNIDVFYSGDTYASMKTLVPTLIVCHDIAYKHYPNHLRQSHKKYYQNNFPKFHKKAEHIVAVSSFTKNDIIDTYAISPEKVSIGYNATPQGFTPLDSSTKEKIREDLTEGKPYFIYVGSLHPRKNVVNLIKAFDHFKKKYKTDHKLVLVGRMAWKNEELKKTYETTAHRDAILFTGHISNAQLPQYLAAADALTYVSVFEGFGIPILEGMSSGTPVITSNVSSMPEVAGDAALLIDPHNPISIAEGMFEITSNPDLREKLIEKGMERAKEFSWKKTADHIYTQLKKIKQ